MSSPEEIARNEHAPVTRAEAPVSGISVPAHLAVGSDLVDGIDYVVWLQVMYDTASGRPVSPIQTWQRLQERGIRSTKNRAELVGKNTVYESYARIIEAGYFERYEVPNEKHPGRKGPIAYRVYDNPAWNPTWQARHVGSDPLRDGSVKTQVRMLPGTGDDSKHDRTPDGKDAGQNASRNWGSGVPGSGVPGSGTRRVPAGRNASLVPGSIEPSPPHPPEEEVGTTSPSPQKHATTSRRKGEAPTVDAADAAAATQFLMRLPGKWAAGVQRAQNLAPWLVHNAALTGWSLDLELRMYLTRPDGKRAPDNYGAVLAHRIKNMQHRDEVLAAVNAGTADEPAQEAPASSGMPEWCGQCESPSYRWFAPEDGPAKQCPDCNPIAIARRSRAGA